MHALSDYADPKLVTHMQTLKVKRLTKGYTLVTHTHTLISGVNPTREMTYSQKCTLFLTMLTLFKTNSSDGEERRERSSTTDSEGRGRTAHSWQQTQRETGAEVCELKYLSAGWLGGADSAKDISSAL